MPVGIGLSYGVHDSGQVASGHLFCDSPFVRADMEGWHGRAGRQRLFDSYNAVIALGLWIAWSQRELRKDPAAILATRP